MIRRSIAGLVLGPSLLLASLAWSGYQAQRTVFDPERSQEIADELLENDEVRAQLTDNLAGAIEAALPTAVPLSADQVDEAAAMVLADPAVEELVVTAFTSAHAAFLGQGTAPRTLDLTPAADAARAALVEVAPGFEAAIPETPVLTMTLPTDRIPNAEPVDDFLDRMVPITAIIAAVGAALALLMTTDRPSVLSRAGIWALSITAFYLLVGIGLPWLLRRTAPDQTEVFAALVTALLRTTLLPSIVLAACGTALVVMAIAWPDKAKRSAPAPEPPPQPLPMVGHGPLRRPLPPQRPLVHPDTPPAGIAPARPPTPTGTGPAMVVPPPAGPSGTEPAGSGSPGSPPASGPTPAAGSRPPPAPPAQPDLRPPPLPTAASTSSGETERPPPPPTGDAGEQPPGSSRRLPTKEQGERKPKWRAPQWVEGHGWVLDPDDPEPPPPNSRWIEGVGHVVPGPPPPDA